VDTFFSVIVINVDYLHKLPVPVTYYDYMDSDLKI